MTTFITVQEKIISVELELHAIKIFSVDVLHELLNNLAEAVTDEFINCIKKEYQRLFNNDFNVSNQSMAVEIWGHVYAEKFAETVKDYTSINFIDKIAQMIIHHAEVIDIGEQGHDENRFIWDGLSVLKPVIAGVLFGKQEK